MSVSKKMTAIADAIREKTGETAPLSLDAMADNIRHLPAPIVNTVTGDAVVLADSTDWKLRGLRLFGQTCQDGTPAPEAPVELVSAGDGGSVGVTVAGKNLWSFGEELTFTTYKSTMPVYLPAGPWTFSGIITSDYTEADTCRLVIYDINKRNIGTLQIPKSADGERKKLGFTADKDIHFITVYAADEYKEGYTATWKQMQIEKGLTATEYEPYKDPQALSASTPNGLPGIPVTSGGNYTDEAGQQWVCDEVDFGRGVYVQRIGTHEITGSEAWYHREDNANTSYFQVNLKVSANQDVAYPSAVCTHIVYSRDIHSVDAECFAVLFAESATHIRFRKAICTLSEFTAWLKQEYNAGTPVTVKWCLDIPIETALSAEELAAYAALHTNYPNTTILNDSGAGMEVSYVADTKLYIDNQVAALSAAMLST